MKRAFSAVSSYRSLRWIFTAFSILMLCFVALKIAGCDKNFKMYAALNYIKYDDPGKVQHSADSPSTVATPVRVWSKLFSGNDGQETPTETRRVGPHGSSNPRLIVLPIFSLETDPNQDLSHYSSRPSLAQLESRMTDFMESLQQSLNHPVVARVHVMYTQDALPGYVTKRIGVHPKLTFGKVNSTYEVGKVLEDVHKHFQNELVLLTNGDVYPAQGLELIDYDLMKRKRIMYGLSRHGRQEKRCTMRGQTCDKDTGHIYAQDSYIFIPTEPFPEKAKRVLKNLLWDYFAQEYMLMYVYHSILKYKVLNPCYVVFMYHNHCSGLHHAFRPKYGNKTVYFHPPHSSDLQ